MFTRTILVGLVLVLTGCTTVKTVDLSDSTAEESVSVKGSRTVSYASVNKRAQRKKAHVRLADGRTLKVARLQVTRDSTSWLDSGTRRFETVATADIKEIRFVKHGKGALEGLGGGLLMGAAFGAILGFAGGDDPPCQSGTWFCWRFTAGEKAAFGAVALGAVGGLLGVLTGAGVGSNETYHFSAPALLPQVAADETQQK